MKNFIDYVDILDSKRIPVNSTEREKIKGNIPYYGATGQVDSVNDYLFNEELVLLGEDGAPFMDSFKDKAYLINGKSWVNNHAHVLRGKNGLLNKFLLYWLNIIDYKEYVTGTTRLKLNQARMKNIMIPFPKTMDQRRIVEEIEKQFSRLDDSVKSLNFVKEKLQVYRNAILKSGFDNQLVIGQKKWETKLFGELVLHSQNGYTGRPIDNPSGVPRLGIETVTKSKSLYIDESFVKFIKIDNNIINKYLIKNGDILVCRQNGNRSFVGRFSVYNGSNPNLIFSDSLIRFSVDVKRIIPEYLTFYMNSFMGRNEIDNRCSTTAGNYSINGTSIKNVPITFPDIKVQQIIVREIESKFSVVDKVEEVVEASLNKAEKLRKSILKKAFEGNLIKLMVN
jgi:type I restriction enzyme S subunit